MKKIIVLSLLLFSCKTQEIMQKQSKFVIITWKKNNETFDIYKADSLIVEKIPCDGTNQITLHNYNQGHYKFIFKNNGLVTEEKSITINK